MTEPSSAEPRLFAAAIDSTCFKFEVNMAPGNVDERNAIFDKLKEESTKEQKRFDQAELKKLHVESKMTTAGFALAAEATCLAISTFVATQGYYWCNVLDSPVRRWTINQRYCRLGSPWCMTGMMFFLVTAWNVPADLKLLKDNYEKRRYWKKVMDESSKRQQDLNADMGNKVKAAAEHLRSITA